MYYDDDDRPLTRSDLRRYRWRYWKISLIIGLIVLCGALAWTQSQLTHVTQEQNNYSATGTAVNQQVATQENQPLQGPITIAQMYYTAISNQNYTSAYGDLAASATYNSKPISQAAFVQQAKNQDAKNGPVTNFKVDGGPSDPTVYVQVTRKNGRSYSVMLDCTPTSMEMNGTWKISSFSDI